MTPKKIRRRPILEQLEARRLLDGELDPSWGAGGVAEPIVPESNIFGLDVTAEGNLVGLGSGAAAVFDSKGNGVSVADFLHNGLVLKQHDGRYVVASDNGIFQYAADGTFIKQFTGGNLSAVPNGMESRYRDFVLAPNGDILLAGQVGTSLFGADEAVVHWSGVEVWSPDGQLKAAIQKGTVPQDLQVAAFADGTVFVAMGSQLWRHLPSGALDTSFGDGGKINIPYDNTAEQDLALDQYGRLYVSHSKAGRTSTVTRYRFNGSRDADFGVNGTVNTSILALNGTSATLGHERIFVAPDGRLYVAALADSGTLGDRLAVGRLTAAGTVDTTWGAGGVAVADLPESSFTGGRTRAFVIMPDGDLLVAADPGGGPSVVARFQGTGTGTPGSSPVITVTDGHVSITGTAGNDVIFVRSLADGRIRINANDEVRTLSRTAVHTIAISGGDGADYVDARALRALTNVSGGSFEMTIDGGNGNDVLVGHQGRDRIRGEAGDDKIHGWDGNDWLSGNAQKDRIYGGAGDDVLSGNGGRDRLVGEDGNDTLSGGDQPDLLIGMAGDDSLMGDGGHDRLDGGAGRDFLYGAGGDDTFWARDGEVDQVVGGMAALDRAQVDEDDVLAGIEELLA